MTIKRIAFWPIYGKKGSNGVLVNLSERINKWSFAMGYSIDFGQSECKGLTQSSFDQSECNKVISMEFLPI